LTNFEWFRIGFCKQVEQNFSRNFASSVEQYLNKYCGYMVFVGMSFCWWECFECWSECFECQFLNCTQPCLKTHYYWLLNI